MTTFTNDSTDSLDAMSSTRSLLRIAAALVAIILLIPIDSARAQTQVEIELNAATNALIFGRDYLVGFPQQKTRNGLRRDYLGVDDTGEPLPGYKPKITYLREAIDHAVNVRLETDAGGNHDANFLAQTVAWEALEALLQGQLITGNGNLLKGLRVAFPNAVGGGEKPGGENGIPVGCPVNASGQEYIGANLRDLCYAKGYFQEGISTAIDFISKDTTGEIRYFEPLNSPFEQYTYFSTPQFRDPNFTDPMSIQTTGYLLGNLLDRYGKAVIGMGDRLWRGAYFLRERAPGQPRAAERKEMLDKAVKVMQQGVHAQFMAALPLAATMDEGDQGYGKCRVDQVRVSAATAVTFIDRIRRGEVPKLDNLGLNSSSTDIAGEISLVHQLKSTAGSKYSLAETALWRKKDAQNQVIAEAQSLRLGLTEQLTSATGINPGPEGVAPYFGLTTGIGRSNYRNALNAKLEAMIHEGLTSAQLTDGSEVGSTLLQILRAKGDIESANHRIQNIPAQIAVEEARNGTANFAINTTTKKVTSAQLSIALVQAFPISATVGFSCPPCAPSFSMSAGFTPTPLLANIFQEDITRAQAIQQLTINNASSAATIQNLLLQQNQFILDAKASVAQGQLAIASFHALQAKIDRLLENHIYVQTSNNQKWYSDPAIIFEQERAELDYQAALTEYVRELYVLSQKLAVRWSEPFENPYLRLDGAAETLGGGLFDDFTQAESVFNIYRASEGDNFLNALQEWDLRLRNARQGGQADVQARISLRQDIFGYSDVIYNTAAQRFETNPDAAARELNKRRFRALLLRAQQPASSPFLVRLEFPITYGQFSRIVTGNLVAQPTLLPVSRSDWNVRVTELAAKVIGQNVAQNAFNTIRLDLTQYGKLEIPKYHPRQANVYPNFLTFNLPLYYPDPEEASVSAYHFSLNAGINGNVGQPNAFVPQVEPTPFCDRYVLLIERAANPAINLQNIEDIELTVRARSGVPPSFSF